MLKNNDPYRHVIQFEKVRIEEEDVESLKLKNKLRKVIGSVELDKTQESEILNKIRNYKGSTNHNWNKQYTYRSKIRPRYVTNVIKIAIVLVMIILIGGTSAIASNLIFRTKTIHMDFMTIEERDLISKNSTIEYTHFNHRTMKLYGIKDITNMENIDEQNPVMSYGIDDFVVGTKNMEYDYLDSAKSAGDAAFAEVNMPNLIPDYLYDKYYLVSPGFSYDYLIDTWGTETSRVTGHFSKLGHDAAFGEKSILVQYDSYKIMGITSYIYEDRPRDSIQTIMYTTKNGIECEIVKEGESANVNLVFDSEEYGEGTLSFIFLGIGMKDIEKILDDIPYLGTDFNVEKIE